MRRRTRFALVLSGAAVLLAPVSTVPAQVAHAQGTTVVTIGFDDSNADQFKMLKMLAAHGMNATFFTNSGFVGTADHLTWGQLHQLYAAGNEIGGHTIDHANVKKLKTPAARHEICDDRVAIYDHGLAPESFAYPFGNHDAASMAVVQACGYNSGRTVSGVDDRKTFAETIPPLDPYATRTPPNPKMGTTLATLESYVTEAEQNGGGWVQYVFHHVCGNNCDPYSITPWEMNNFLAWLETRSANGTVVETTSQVIGGTLQPPVPA